MYRRVSLCLIALAAAACADRGVTSPEVQPEPQLAASVLGTAGSAVVVFESETSVPTAGLDLIAQLGGTITSQLDGIGVAFVAGLSALGLQTLRASPLVEDAGPDYVLNWLPGLRIGGVVEANDDGTPQADDPSRASQFRTWQWGRSGSRPTVPGPRAIGAARRSASRSSIRESTS